MTRYLVVRILAALLGVVAWAFGGLLWLLAVVVALLTVTALGVVMPRLQFFGPFVCHGAGQQRRVALTFDDGPDAGSTPILLDLLRDERTSAAFFCVGEKVAAHPELAARTVREGHLLENHSYSHNHLTNLFSVTRLRTELVQTQEIIQRTTGIVPSCFRPPMGLSNPRVFRAARKLGLKVVGWSVRGLDTKLSDPEQIVARIVRQLEPGAIILLHDGNIPAERLVLTVKRLLDTVRALGYDVVRLDQLLK